MNAAESDQESTESDDEFQICDVCSTEAVTYVTNIVVLIWRISYQLF